MINNIFPIPVYKSKFIRNINNLEIAKVKKLLKDFYPNAHNTTSKENFVLDNHKEFLEIREFIQVHLNQYALHLYKPKRKQNFYITQSWLNSTKKGERHHLHSHPNSVISGVFYINCIENDGIQFKRPYIANDSYVLNTTGNTGSMTYFPVETLSLILFPSYLEHQVAENETDDERISLSFNTHIKGEIGAKESLTYLDLR